MNTLTTNNTTATSTTITNTKGTTMNTTTTLNNFKAILTTRNNWRADTLRAAAEAAWMDVNTANTPNTGEIFKNFLSTFETKLKAAGKFYTSSSNTLALFNKILSNFEGAEIAPQPVAAPVAETAAVHQGEVIMEKRIVRVYTDGSCDVHGDNKPGGWGVFLICGTKTREVSGFEENTTNNAMELRAMEEGIKAVDFSSTDKFNYELVTDSKYVLRTIANKAKYEARGFKKVANIEAVKSLYSTMEEEGILIQSALEYKGEQTMSSGDVYASAKDGSVLFIWEKGHTGGDGNEKADKLAVAARKMGPEANKVEATPTVPEAKEEVSQARSLAAQLLGMGVEESSPKEPEAEVVEEPVIEKVKATEDDSIVNNKHHIIVGRTPFQGETSYWIEEHNPNSEFCKSIGCSSEEFCIESVEWYSEERALELGLKPVEEEVSHPEKYGYVVYENDYVTMSNPEGGFVEHKVLVKKWNDRFIANGVFYETLNDVMIADAPKGELGDSLRLEEVKDLEQFAKDLNDFEDMPSEHFSVLYTYTAKDSSHTSEKELELCSFNKDGKLTYIGNIYKSVEDLIKSKNGGTLKTVSNIRIKC